MSDDRKDEKPNPQEVVATILGAAQKLRRHEGQFLTAVLLLEKAATEIYRNLEPMA